MNLFSAPLFSVRVALFLAFGSLCVFGSALRAADSPDQQFVEAQKAFETGDYRKAQSLGEAILNEGYISPTLFQLLGNTRYREGDLGRATLWYQRAALFPPPSPETRQNLTHVRERTGNLTFPGNTLGDQIVAYLSRNQWLSIAVICGWAWLFLHLIAFLWMRPGELRVFSVTLGLVALLCGALSITCWYNRPSFEEIKDLAIVTAPNSVAHTAATVTSGTVVSLPPGSEVRKLVKLDAWCYVEIPSSHGETNRGWVQTDALSDFWPDRRPFNAGYLE